MSSKNPQNPFEILKGAQPKLPLLTTQETRLQLGRSVVVPNTVNVGKMMALAALITTIGVIAFITFVPKTTTERYTEKSVQHSAVPETVLPVIPDTAADTVTSTEPIAVPRAEFSPKENTPTRVLSNPATIVGVQFLDLDKSEFEQLPSVIAPEIITTKTSGRNANSAQPEQRTLECLLYTKDAASIVDNGKEYVQTRALFIPIRVIEETQNSHKETIRWYRPTGDLIAMLPERYRVQMMIELNLLSEVARGCITPKEACRSLPTSESYFDMCRLDASQIKDVVVAPNPINTSAKAIVTLQYQTVLHIALFSTSGVYITELFPQTALDAGVHHLDISTQGLHSGLYLLTVTTNGGEHVVRQIFVE